MKEKFFTTKMKTLLLGLFMVLVGQNLLGQAVTVGTTGSDYPTLTQAFADIDAGNLTGDIELQIIDNTVESETAVLHESGFGGTSFYTSVKIYPTVTGVAITGVINGPLIQLFSATNVTIDGRLNQLGSTVDLTLINSAPGDQTGIGGASTINFHDSATDNVVKYCTIIGAEEHSTRGTIYFSCSALYTGVGNDNNLIDHNIITGNGPASRPINSIFASGLSTAVNDNITISNNNFYNFFRAGASSNGVNLNAYTTASSVIGNSFYETTSFAPTAIATYIPIFIQSTAVGNGFTVTGNSIGGSDVSCGGTPWTKTNAQDNIFYGIELELGTGTATSLQNNTIKNIAWSNSGSAAWTGIQIVSGDVNVGTTTGNTIGTNNSTGSITVTGGATGTNVYGINIASTGTVDCQNNIIGSITAANGAANASNITGINKAAGIGTTTISGNTIGSTNTSNSINASSIVTGANDQTVVGINNAGSGTITISSNTIANLTNGTTLGTITRRGFINGITSSDGTNTISGNTIYNLTIGNGNTANNPASVAGIGLTGVTLKTVTGNEIHDLSNTFTNFGGNVFGCTFIGDASGANEFSGNTIYNLSSVGGTGAAKVTGLNFNVGTGANLVKKNFIYGLSAGSGNTTVLNGIKIFAGSATYSNNIVTLGGATTNTIYGIYETGGAGTTNKLYHNTVYIGGTVGSGTLKSYGLYSAVTTNTRDFRNNIFANTRTTTGGANLHYAANIVTAGGTITNDYNDYYITDTNDGRVLGYYGGAKTALPIVTGQDANSTTLDPQFTTPGGTAAADYHVKSNVIGLTTSTTGITSDYLDVTRSTVIPTMGALEDHNYWRGTNSIDWNTTTNWSKGVVPFSGDNVIFDIETANIKNHLTMDAANDRIVNSIYNPQSTYRTVLNGKHLTVKGALVFMGGAQLDASATGSILEFNGAAQQTIPSGSLFNNNVYDLTINNTSNVLLYGTANLLRLLTATAGKLDAITNTPTFVYKGSAAQTIETNQFLNDQIYNLTIWNAAGVTLNNTALTTVTNTFTIETTGKFTIPVNRQLTASGTTDNRGGATGLVIKSFWHDTDAANRGTGSLIVTGAAIGSGTVERYMYQTQWHLVSPPAIEDLYTAGTGFLARNLAIPYWDQTPANLGIAHYLVADNKWQPYATRTTNTTGIVMDPGAGYMVRTARYDGPGSSGTDHGPTVLDFQGTLTSDSKTVTLSRTGVFGWNCIGNPFTSAISLYDGTQNVAHTNNFLDVNGGAMEASYLGIYIMNASGTYDIVNYASTATNAALGQGFFVKAAANNNTVTFTKAMQIHELENGGTPFKSGTTSWPSIKLTASFDAAKVSTDIKFIDGTTKGLDKGYDAGLFRTDASNVLYTRLVDDMGVGFQLQCLPANQYNSLIIPVGIESKAGGEVVFSAEALNLDAGCNVVLEDKLTKRFTDLKSATYKTLVPANTVSSDRFFLHTSDIISGIGDQTLSGGLNAYAFSNSEIRIIGEVGNNATANLYDVLGRLVVSHLLGDGNYNVLSIPSVKKGVYLLNIKTKDSTQTLKVMVRN